MNADLLHSIDSPAELRNLTNEQLVELAAQIRMRLIEVTSVNGGHLASSLGAVELILALHRCFDFSTDHLVFDVGHQSYAHKLITGRLDDFDTLRTYGGICGFPRRDESPYDTHEAGHASDSLSIALGLALTRDLNNTDERIVALIGDAALSGGMAFEALNQIGHQGSDLTIVLNDNEMSISHNVGALSLYLGKARLSKPYTKVRDSVESRLNKLGRPGRFLVNAGEAAKASFKKLVVPGMFFEDMGITYVGPIDGHNLLALQAALGATAKVKGPVLLHAVTQKGRGFAPAEQHPDVFHGVGSYDASTGELAVSGGFAPKFTSVFSAALVKEAAVNPNIVAITAAMEDGTGLHAFHEAYPQRFFDVGIAEEHAVALAAGLALGGKLPVVAIYSTFLQRAFDQMVVNVALQEQHVVFCLDRAGLVGEDGPTHHGAFDLAYLRAIPGMRILAPVDAQQLADCLHTALALGGGPVALRYPRGAVAAVAGGGTGAAGGAAVAGGGAPGAAVAGDSGGTPQTLPYAQAVTLREGRDVALLAVGRMVATALEVADLLAADGIAASVYNMLWVKPLDTQAIAAASTAKLVVTLEEGTILGGFGAGVLEELSALAVEAGTPQTPVLTIGLPDAFVPHGDVERLFEDLGLTAGQIHARVRQALDEQPQTTS
ncbi:MAG: 1-deoxy-D-xylulose-5-phosphate synthase [Coriobacteriales bacterium]|jgi:1-deoxy-D-xylulose-5-phosphate synthase|nr:1-deoxy-D-xylulose-5-phosphate synthase [Coriobacteriales bacterium]